MLNQKGKLCIGLVWRDNEINATMPQLFNQALCHSGRHRDGLLHRPNCRLGLALLEKSCSFALGGRTLLPPATILVVFHRQDTAVKDQQRMHAMPLQQLYHLDGVVQEAIRGLRLE